MRIVCCAIFIVYRKDEKGSCKCVLGEKLTSSG